MKRKRCPTTTPSHDATSSSAVYTSDIVHYLGANVPNQFTERINDLLWTYEIIPYFTLKDICRCCTVSPFVQNMMEPYVQDRSVPLRVPEDVSRMCQARDIIVALQSRRIEIASSSSSSSSSSSTSTPNEMAVFARPVDILVGPGEFMLDEVVERIIPSMPGDKYLRGASRIIHPLPGEDRLPRQPPLPEGVKETYGFVADCSLHIKGSSSETEEPTCFIGGTFMLSDFDVVLQDIKLDGRSVGEIGPTDAAVSTRSRNVVDTVFAMLRCEVMNARNNGLNLWSDKVILVDCEFHHNGGKNFFICRGSSYIRNLCSHHSNQDYGEEGIYLSGRDHHFYGSETSISSSPLGIYANHGAHIFLHSLHDLSIFSDIQGENITLGTKRGRKCKLHHVE